MITEEKRLKSQLVKCWKRRKQLLQEVLLLRAENARLRKAVGGEREGGAL